MLSPRLVIPRRTYAFGVMSLFVSGATTTRSWYLRRSPYVCGLRILLVWRACY